MAGLFAIALFAIFVTFGGIRRSATGNHDRDLGSAGHQHARVLCLHWGPQEHRDPPRIRWGKQSRLPPRADPGPTGGLEWGQPPPKAPRVFWPQPRFYVSRVVPKMPKQCMRSSHGWVMVSHTNGGFKHTASYPAAHTQAGRVHPHFTISGSEQNIFHVGFDKEFQLRILCCQPLADYSLLGNRRAHPQILVSGSCRILGFPLKSAPACWRYRLCGATPHGGESPQDHAD